MDAYEFMRIAGEYGSRSFRCYADFAGARGISYNELAVLYVIYKKGKCLQKNICAEWFLPKQTVNATCKKMLADGLIQCERNDKDGREVYLSFTAKGKKFAEPVVEKLLETENAVLKETGDEAAQKFLEMYVEINDRIAEKFAEAGKRL